MVYVDLLPFAEHLTSILATEMGEPNAGYHFHVKRQADMRDLRSWPDAIQWLASMTKVYEEALQEGPKSR
jgi:hypothetical protein